MTSPLPLQAVQASVREHVTPVAAVARPLTFGKVFLAVILGNVCCGIAAAVAYEILK